MKLFSEKFLWVLFVLVVGNSCSSEEAGCRLGFLGAGQSGQVEIRWRNPVSASDDWKQDFFTQDSGKTYSQIKSEVIKIKSQIRYESFSTDSLERLFTDLLVYKIIPYWYGTTWSFEGHTSVPNQGEIACGYFVSTTLLHAGLNVNRYKLAQQLPEHEAESLVLEDSVLIISHQTTEEIITEIDEKTSEGIYFLGFDASHVGFLLKKENKLYVLHSNYIGAQGVTVEKIEESEAFKSYRKFYVCPLSTNAYFLKCWQQNVPIVIIETP